MTTQPTPEAARKKLAAWMEAFHGEHRDMPENYPALAVSIMAPPITWADLKALSQPSPGVRPGLEAAARWHYKQSSLVMGGLHCGSENDERWAARRTADFHTNCAAAIRNLAPGGLEGVGEESALRRAAEPIRRYV
jgi:hypothetical protein